jgi:hypothetical protein
VARDKRTAANLGAWLCYEDKSGRCFRDVVQRMVDGVPTIAWIGFGTSPRAPLKPRSADAF